MGYSSVQTASGTGTHSATFGSASTIGNAVILRVVYIFGASITGPPTVGDSSSNTYTLQSQAETTTGANKVLVAIYTAPITTAGTLTVEYVPHSGVTTVSISIEEASFTGTLTIDGTSSAVGTGTSLSSGSITTTGGSDLVVGVGGSTATGQTWTPGGSFSSAYSQTGASGDPAMLAVDQYNVSSGTIAATMTDTVSSPWACAVVALSGGVSDVLTASPGSYVVTGVNATLLDDRAVFAGPGSFSVTGENASLTENVGTLSANPGSYAITGENASFAVSATMLGSPGSFAVTGVNASLTENVGTLSASPGSYAVVGESAALLHDRKANASAGSYAITGKPAGLDFGLIATASPGSYSVSGESATLEYGHAVVASSASYSVNGIAAALSPSGLLEADPGSYTVGRISAELTSQHDIFAVPAAYVVTGIAAALEQPATLNASPGSYSIGGVAATLGAGHIAFGNAAPYTITGLPAVLVFTGPSGDVNYHIYSNNGLGGAIDYDSPIDTTASLTYTTGPLAFPGSWTFGVRAFYVGPGLEEQNVDAVVTILLDAAGKDITNQPSPPVGLRAFPIAAGSIRVEWTYPPAVGAKIPTGFHVYLGTGTLSYTTPVATVLFGTAIANSYVYNSAALSNGVTYTIGVRAFNVTAEESNTNTVTATAVTVGPTAVVSLTAIATS
jgi:hypothetical protein